MSEKITLVYSYYENPEMFKIHQKHWMAFPDWVKSRLEVIVTDDCSSLFPIEEHIIVPQDFPMRLFRITQKVDWNWRAARNIGAYKSEPGTWLFVTDIDHLLPTKTIFGLYKKLDGGILSKKYFYTFDRVIAPDFIPYKNHPNTYFLHRELYLTVGGYDEFVSGYYGLDGVFRRRLERDSQGNLHLSGMTIDLYQRDFVPDASLDSSVMSRKEGRDSEKLAEVRQAIKKRFQSGIRPQTLSFPYEQVR